MTRIAEMVLYVLREHRGRAAHRATLDRRARLPGGPPHGVSHEEREHRAIPWSGDGVAQLEAPVHHAAFAVPPCDSAPSSSG